MSKTISVLAVTNAYPTDEMPGDSPCIRDQVMTLRAHGIEVEVLHVDRSRGKSSYARAAWQLFETSLQKKRYDLIHAYYGHCGLLARLQFRYPIVVTFRGSDLLSRRDGAIGGIVARLADAVIVMSEEMKQVAKRQDAHVIPFGVNLRLFTPYPLESARRELGLPLSAKLVLFPWDPARPVKRFDVIEKAIQLLQREQAEARLVVVFDKPHEIVAKYMNACDAMVMASEWEGAPMAVREAMACNLAIVSVNVGDVGKLIGAVEGCYLCERTPEDVAAKLKLVLEHRHRPDTRAIIAELNSQNVARRVVAVYEEVLTTRYPG